MDDLHAIGPDPAMLLRQAPRDEYALLELDLEWPGLEATQQRVAARLRFFVITRDPLSWISGRGEAWATANADGDVLELVVYVALDAVEDGLDAASGDLPRALAPFAAPVVMAGAASEHLLVSGAHPELVSMGAAGRLLDDVDATNLLQPSNIRVRSAGWEPIGLGAIQDLVQDAFGPVALDRSTVRLDPVRELVDDCPACRGEGFGFPADLDLASALMCPEHRQAAAATTAARLSHARTSNPLGWRAIGKASARIHDLPEPGGAPLPPARASQASGRNDPCPCGSGRKYKRCCGA